MIYLVTSNTSLIATTKYKVISVEESLRLLDELKIIGLDTETSGIDVHTKKLLSLQLGCYDFQVFIDCRTIDPKLYKGLLEDPNKLFLLWNAKFDLKFLLKEGILVSNIYDGYLAEKLLWLGYPAGMHSLSLKSAGLNYCEVELDKSVRGKIIYTPNLTDEIIEYGAYDVKYLEKIYDKQHEGLEEKDLLIAVRLENKFCPVLAYTEFCGAKLDETKWRAKMAKDQARFDKAQSDLNNWVVDYYKSHNGTDSIYVEEMFTFSSLSDYDTTTQTFTPIGEYKVLGPKVYRRIPSAGGMSVGMDIWEAPIRRKYPFVKVDLQGDLFSGFDTEPKCSINWSSPKQVIPFLQYLGFNLETYDKKTKEKKLSVGADVIEKQLTVSEIAPIYLEYKAAEKVIGTYGENILKQINPNTGRLHTNFNQLGADTGRLSSGGKDKENNVEYINFQNFPRDAETRGCFVSEPGNKWISCDYSAQESRVMADLSNDEEMIKAFANGIDLHSLVASKAYKNIIGDCPIEEIKSKFKKQRQDAKSVELTKELQKIKLILLTSCH